jgi:hypothetical protein
VLLLTTETYQLLLIRATFSWACGTRPIPALATLEKLAAF